jgi:hypothetical protein
MKRPSHVQIQWRRMTTTMARTSAISLNHNSDTIYTPPSLPPYLKNVYDLKPFVGVPNDEEVKGIHAVIRAASNVSQSEHMLTLSSIFWPFIHIIKFLGCTIPMY